MDTTAGLLSVVAAAADGVLSLCWMVVAVELAVVLTTVPMPTSLATVGRLFAAAAAAGYVPRALQRVSSAPTMPTHNHAPLPS